MAAPSYRYQHAAVARKWTATQRAALRGNGRGATTTQQQRACTTLEGTRGSVSNHRSQYYARLRSAHRVLPGVEEGIGRAVYHLARGGRMAKQRATTFYRDKSYGNRRTDGVMHQQTRYLSGEGRIGRRRIFFTVRVGG